MFDDGADRGVQYVSWAFGGDGVEGCEAGTTGEEGATGWAGGRGRGGVWGRGGGGAEWCAGGMGGGEMGRFLKEAGVHGVCVAVITKWNCIDDNKRGSKERLDLRAVDLGEGRWKESSSLVIHHSDTSCKLKSLSYPKSSVLHAIIERRASVSGGILFHS
jgi:hypothetical protein